MKKFGVLPFRGFRGLRELGVPSSKFKALMLFISESCGIRLRSPLKRRNSTLQQVFISQKKGFKDDREPIENLQTYWKAKVWAHKKMDKQLIASFQSYWIFEVPIRAIAIWDCHEEWAVIMYRFARCSRANPGTLRVAHTFSGNGGWDHLLAIFTTIVEPLSVYPANFVAFDPQNGEGYGPRHDHDCRFSNVGPVVGINFHKRIIMIYCDHHHHRHHHHHHRHNH